MITNFSKFRPANRFKMSLENFRQITPEQLRQHCTEDDAWISIKGHVYDVTKYLLFHPGGVEQIMQAVGMDGTHLFFDVHPNVNYDQILAKYIVGALTSSETSIRRLSEYTRENVAKAIQTQKETLDDTPSVTIDWMQRSGSINFFFYTGTMSNPYIQISPIVNKRLDILITHSDYNFEISIDLYSHLRWPPKFKVNAETGKIDVVFDKAVSDMWKHFGNLTMVATKGTQLSLAVYKNLSKKRITHDCFLLEFDRVDGVLNNIPICYNLNYIGSGGVIRKYLGVPSCVTSILSPEKYTTSHLFIIVKRYNTGNVSKFLVRLRKNDRITMDNPSTQLEFKVVTYFKQFMMLVAGTGINPMVSLILFLLERRIKPCETIVLVSFNHQEEDIILKKEIKDLATREPRFKAEFVVTSDPTWTGLKGHIGIDMIMKLIKDGFKSNVLITREIMFFVCGPFGFIRNTNHGLCQLSVAKRNIVIFSTMEISRTGRFNIATY